MTSNDKNIIDPRTERLVGVSPDGIVINNVTEENRYDIDVKNPWVIVHLVTENQDSILHTVKIPNTRERPDVVMYKENVYEVVDTRCDPAVYRAVMKLEAKELDLED